MLSRIAYLDAPYDDSAGNARGAFGANTAADHGVQDDELEPSGAGQGDGQVFVAEEAMDDA